MISQEQQRLLDAAWKAREEARCAYSGFAVGAALECSDGTIVCGCNVESSSYGLSCCAERVALFKALSEGRDQFTRIAVVTGAAQVCPPCGACRQLLADYCANIEVIMANPGDTTVVPFSDLLPFSFDASFLEKK